MEDEGGEDVKQLGKVRRNAAVFGFVSGENQDWEQKKKGH